MSVCAAGEVVLDLAAAAGWTSSSRLKQVAPGGHAYGIDLTDEMVDLANRNRERAGVENATFLKGAIEQVPLSEGTVDVVISNGTINLADDKGRHTRSVSRG